MSNRTLCGSESKRLRRDAAKGVGAYSAAASDEMRGSERFTSRRQVGA